MYILDIYYKSLRIHTYILLINYECMIPTLYLLIKCFLKRSNKCPTLGFQPGNIFACREKELPLRYNIFQPILLSS